MDNLEKIITSIEYRIISLASDEKDEQTHTSRICCLTDKLLQLYDYRDKKDNQ